MYSVFLNIKTEKQERIIDAALTEFAQKGYDNASTNEIIKKAGISKGLLFHYFKNKKGLFLFLYNYCIDLIAEEIYKKIDLDESDIFIKIKRGMELKFELLQKYQDLFIFLEVAYTENSSEVRNELSKINEKLIEVNYGKLFENIDKSLFKEDVDLNKAINILIWTLDGFSNQELKKQKILLTLNRDEYRKILNEAEKYIDFLKSCFYK